MQYPQIQFYRGSLVRLATGQLKQVEDLSSDDFLESARLAANPPQSTVPSNSINTVRATSEPSASSVQSPTFSSASSSSTSSSTSLQFTGLVNSSNNQPNLGPNRNLLSYSAAQLQATSRFGEIATGSAQLIQRLNDDNNNSVFNSPDQTSTSFESQTMDTDECSYGTRIDHHRGHQHHQGDDDDDDNIDVELDVVSDDTLETKLQPSKQEGQSKLSGQNIIFQDLNTGLVCATDLSSRRPITNCNSNGNSNVKTSFMSSFASHSNVESDDDLYIDSSVVRDFLEVGPPCSTSPASSTGSLNHNPTSSSDLIPTPSSSLANLTPNTAAQTVSDQTVLIKFFLETSRSIAFIEVPIEHPFFVFHRGWSSWNPQRTYDKFGLKCRKLKIGDTCISLIRRRRRQQNSDCKQQQESDQCNILFSSIKIHE